MSNLTQRNNYGNFHTQANLSQTLYGIIIQHYASTHKTEDSNTSHLPNFMSEALHMICIKIAQITNGNPSHIPSWEGVAEYAQLAADVLSDYEKLVKQKEAEARAEAEKNESNKIVSNDNDPVDAEIIE